MRQRFLRTLVYSAAMLNPIRNYQFLVLTRQPAQWQPLMHTEPFAVHCLAVESLTEPADLLPSAANRWLIKLASLAERRRSLSVQGPALLVIFDDLSAVNALSSEARQDLEWLIREGPLVRVRLAAALGLSEAENLAGWVRLFGTRLVGSAGGALAATPLLGDRFLRLKPGQYAVRVREEWLRFQAPSLPDEA